MDKEFVKHYISKYSNQVIVNRAIGVYNSNQIKSVDIDNNNEVAKYEIKGTKLYKIKITDFNSQELNVQCSCPYDSTILCKHGLAAIFHLEKNLKKQIAYSKVVKANNLYKRNTNDPLEIKEASNLVSEKFHLHYHLDTQNYVFNDYKFKIISFKNSMLQFDASPEYGYRDSFQILIEKKGAKYFVKSTGRNNERAYVKPHIYPIEYHLLKRISDLNPSFLEKIFEKKIIDKIILETATNYGLENEKDFKKYFSYTADIKHTFKVKLKDEFSGLIPVGKTKRKLVFDDFIKEITKPKEVISLIKSTETTIKTMVLGFMISKKMSRFKRDFQLTITPLKGNIQKNKDNLIRIKEFEENIDYSNCEITENQKELLTKIKAYNSSSDFSEDEEEILTTLKNIFKLLRNERFVYLFKDHSGYDSYYSRLLKSKLFPIKISKHFLINVRFKIEKNDAFIEAKSVFYTKDKILDIAQNNDDFISKNSFFIDSKIYIADSTAVFNLYHNFQKNSMAMLKQYEEEFIEKYVFPLSQKFDIEFEKGLKYSIEKENLESEKKQLFLEEEEDFLVITPQVKYNNDLETKLLDRQDIYKKNKYIITQFIRNKEFENDYLEFIASLHPSFEAQKDEGIFYLPIEAMTENMWFFHFFDQLKTENVDIFGLKELKKFNYSPHKAKVQTNISSGEDWFDVNVNVSFGNQHISLKDIRKAIVNKDKFIKLNDDSVGILPEDWLEKMSSYFRHGEIEGENLKVSKMKFSIIDELFEGIDQEEILEEIHQKKQQLKKFKEIAKVKVPNGIKANLRDYQKEGLNWLHFLHKMKWGGILADDMGLGKTIQIITLLESLKKKSKLANLIILPTSLMFNWENELKKFAPGLKPYFHYGMKRGKDKAIFKNNDLVISTYGIMAKDIEFLSSYTFNYIILDESQAIKNPNSQRYKASMLLKAKHKLTLTGTPIENNTFDLYAQMNFVNPGFFGSIKAFKDNYAMPIDKDGDKEMAEELQKLITPFLLRRTKEQVATELPPKTEDVIYCEMLPQQRKIYDAYKNEYKNQILEKIETDGLNKSKLFVLAALTKLRQICDSPLLLKDKHIDTSDSTKINILLEHINEKTANHKILIFSQFTSMLALIREQLDDSEIVYEYLDGKSTTKNRQKSVENFQKNKKVRVFLISLKAGGTGLNLTEADYVYIVDPWWNPAVENQAIDRCYRIGQDKSVMAYRLICKNTIEEKIIKLQNKKKQLASDIIQTDEKIMKTIDKNSLMDLFS